MTSWGIRLVAFLTVLGYAALVYTLLGQFGVVALEAIFWVIFPLLLPLTITLASKEKRTQLGALGLLLCFAFVGAPLLVWGLFLNPGDDNHLILIFLPIHQFTFMGIALAVFAFATLLRRFADTLRRYTQ
jgi:hypothetical protein